MQGLSLLGFGVQMYYCTPSGYATEVSIGKCSTPRDRRWRVPEGRQHCRTLFDIIAIFGQYIFVGVEIFSSKWCLLLKWVDYSDIDRKLNWQWKTDNFWTTTFDSGSWNINRIRMSFKESIGPSSDFLHWFVNSLFLFFGLFYVYHYRSSNLLMHHQIYWCITKFLFKLSPKVFICCLFIHHQIKWQITNINDGNQKQNTFVDF